MVGKDFVGKSNLELLQLHARVIEELRRREVLRSKNNPTGDYAEWLVATRLGMKLEVKSTAGYDAVDAEGSRFQIKARRITADNGSRQLGIIRKLDSCQFDNLIAILFRSDYSIMSAYAIPHVVIADYAKFIEHTNGHVLHLRGPLLEDDRVQEITSKLS
jgi:hypothetical protein